MIKLVDVSQQPVPADGEEVWINPDCSTGWMVAGACRSYPTDMFFPTDGAGVERAKKICKACPVVETCLEHALSERIEHGVWGAASERHRRRILAARKLDVTPLAS